MSHVLVLGATGYLGPHYVRAALEAGHRVSVFTRGSSELPAGVEPLLGNRDDDLRSLLGRRFDAVIDVSTYGPRWVRTLGAWIGGAVGHYTLVSSQDVYAAPERNRGGTDERAPVRRYTDASDPYLHTALYRTKGLGLDQARRSYLGIEQAKQMYGSLKYLCEQEAEDHFPGRALVLRPGLIVGPGDRNPAFPHLVGRISLGGEVMVTGSPDTPVQLIDARDVAAWTVQMIENGEVGVYNVAGPASPTSLLGLLDAIAHALAVDPTITWVPTSWLVEQEDFWPMGALFWSRDPGGFDDPGNLEIGAALAKGLHIRPLAQTIEAIYEWASEPARYALGTVASLSAGASGKLERVSLPWPDFLERESEVLERWHNSSRAAPTPSTGSPAAS